MKKLLNKDNITNLGITIIGSIIFIQIVTPAMEIVKNMGNGIVKALVNYFYSSCSHASSTGFIGSVAYIVLIVLYSFASMVLSSVTFPPKHNESKSEKKAQAAIEKSENNTEKDIADQLVEIEKKVANIQESIKSIEDKENKSKKRQAILSRILLVLLTCWLIIMIVYEYFPLLRKEKFDREIIQIAPYVDDSEIVRLKADWVSMETQEDYLKLKQDVQSIMDANNIE